MATLSYEEKEEILGKCNIALNNVAWNNNTTFTADTTLSQAIQSARLNMDAGLHGALSMMPSTSNFHEWMDFVHLVTIYYNFGKIAKKFTILRNRVVHIICCIRHLRSVHALKCAESY